MSGALSTGLSGLLAYQRAINVHSQNIANVNTEGYVRQRVELIAQRNSSALTGSAGVSVAQIRRDVNNYLLEQGRSSQSAATRSELMASKADQLVGLVASTDYGLDETLRELRNSFESLATEPTSTIIREEVFTRLQTTIDRLKTMDARMAEFEFEIEARVGEEVSRVNALTQQIANLNAEIARQGIGGRDVSPALLDARDRATQDLADKVGIRATERQDGTTSISTVGGLLLVNGTTAATLARVNDPREPTRGRIALQTGGQSTDITREMTGGVIGGLLDTRSQLIETTRNELGRLAAVVVTTLNERNAAGDDKNGNPGAALFSMGVPSVRPASTNTGSATVSVTLDSVHELTASDYIIERAGATWTIRRLSDDSTVTPTGAGTNADPWIFDGLSVAIDTGAPASGDSFLLRPTRSLIEGIAVSITSGSQLAAAARDTAAGNNQNAFSLVGVFEEKLLESNTRSITEMSLRLTTRLASARDAAALARDVQQQAASEARSEFGDRYGVNLDEEAAELLRYQQAYQASAQVIRIANELFDSLLDAAR
jgi:flagellar hook-associated protein 1 FlgK